MMSQKMRVFVFHSINTSHKPAIFLLNTQVLA